MNSSNINPDKFTSAVAELAVQVETFRGRWLAYEFLKPIAAEIVAGIDGHADDERVYRLTGAAKLKNMWDAIEDRHPGRQFDAIIDELAAFVPSNSRAEIRKHAIGLVEFANGTFADLWEVEALMNAAFLKRVWTDTPEPPQLALAA